MEDIILYSNGCPRCKVLKAKIEQSNIEYVEISDMDVMTSKGFLSVPMLEINGELLNFVEATKWINERK